MRCSVLQRSHLHCVLHYLLKHIGLDSYRFFFFLRFYVILAKLWSEKGFFLHHQTFVSLNRGGIWNYFKLCYCLKICVTICQKSTWTSFLLFHWTIFITCFFIYFFKCLHCWIWDLFRKKQHPSKIITESRIKLYIKHLPTNIYSQLINLAKSNTQVFTNKPH